jgi:hypothetical protein
MGIVFLKEQRIILVEAPTVEVTVQELLTAIRNYEDSIEGMDIYKIADASGKEDLGGGLFVGITLKLINWTLKFEDRGGPSTIICDVGAGNLLGVSGSVELDDLVFINPIEPSTYILVTKTSAVSAALLNAVTLPADVADAVWDETLSEHQIVGSTGEALLIASQGSASISASVDIGAIVDGVWNAQQNDYILSGSFGELLSAVSTSVVETSGTVNTILETTYIISSSVVENGLLLQQISESVNNIIVDSSSIANAVWDTRLSEHLNVGSTGEALDLAASGSATASINVAEIVSGVWNAQQTDYILSGSFGELLAVVSQSVIQTSESVNLLYDNVVYISSSVDQNGVYLQQVSSSVNLIYDQTSYITSSVDLIYNQTTDISQSIIVIEDQITDISQSVNNIQVDTGSIAEAVWSEPIAAYTSSTDSMGGTLYDISQNLSVSGSSPGAIADAVWDEILSQHTGSVGSAGYIVSVMYGLMQNNFRMVDMVYDADKLMTSAKIRIYNNAADAQANVNHLKQWDLTAVYVDGEMTSYLVSE